MSSMCGRAGWTLRGAHPALARSWLTRATAPSMSCPEDTAVVEPTTTGLATAGGATARTRAKRAPATRAPGEAEGRWRATSAGNGSPRRRVDPRSTERVLVTTRPARLIRAHHGTALARARPEREGPVPPVEGRVLRTAEGSQRRARRRFFWAFFSSRRTMSRRRRPSTLFGSESSTTFQYTEAACFQRLPVT